MLDIGCGTGRWLENLKDEISCYVGVDYSKGFVDFLKKKYTNPNYEFYNLSATELSKTVLERKYDLLICTGVMMYINDDLILKFFSDLRNLNPFPRLVYFQESVSVMGERLTLNNVKSDALNSTYSAIYRTQEEYENFFSVLGCKIEKTDLLLDDETHARKETNARYWFLTRNKIWEAKNDCGKNGGLHEWHVRHASREPHQDD